MKKKVSRCVMKLPYDRPYGDLRHRVDSDAVSPSLLRSLILLYLTPYDSLRNNHILPINASGEYSRALHVPVCQKRK